MLFNFSNNKSKDNNNKTKINSKAESKDDFFGSSNKEELVNVLEQEQKQLSELEYRILQGL